METNVDKSSTFKKPSRSSFNSQSIQKSNKFRTEVSHDLKSKDKYDKNSEKYKITDKSLNDTLVAESVHTDTELFNNLNTNKTVENLLLSLDQLEKESQVTSSNKDVALASQTSEKINSILSFLDEEASKGNDFIPKPMKDYKFDEDYFNEFMKLDKNSSQETIKKTSRNDEKKNLKSTKTEVKIPPKKTTDSINISKTTVFFFKLINFLI